MLLVEFEFIYCNIWMLNLMNFEARSTIEKGTGDKNYDVRYTSLDKQLMPRMAIVYMLIWIVILFGELGIKDSVSSECMVIKGKIFRYIKLAKANQLSFWVTLKWCVENTIIGSRITKPLKQSEYKYKNVQCLSIWLTFW